MVTVKIFHNEGEGHFFGFDAATAKLHKAHEFEVAEVADERKLLGKVWHIGNSPELTDEVLAYRGIKLDADGVPTCDGSGKAKLHRGRFYGIRSLSVGDVVTIGDKAYACASIGWDEIDFALVNACHRGVLAR